MVMHARTHPRLHDGYYDRNRAHPYQTVGKNPSKSQSGNYNELRSDRRKDSPSVRQTDSPSSRRSNSGSPRIGSQTSSKSSNSQRTKQRGSSISPSENSTNNQSNAGSNSHSSSDRHSNHDRNISETLDKLNKACAEWSDHISSSGKKYFYNFRTEVSQWEKPKEWAQRDILLKELQKLKERKDCISSSSSSSNRPKTLHTISSSSSSSGSRSKGIESKHSSSEPIRPVQHQAQSSSRHSTHDRPSQHKSVLSALQRTSDTTQQTSNRQHEHKNSRSSNTPTTTETTKSLHRHNIESPLVQDMSSPSPQSTSSRHSQHHQHPLKSPLLHRQSSKSPIVVNSNQQGPRTDELSYNGQSLQQKLQQVEKNIISATNQASPMSLASAASDMSSPQFSPHSTHVSTPSLSNKQQLHEEKNSDSPSSHKSREASPARSIGSHTSGVCHSNPPSAPQLPSSVSLTSSLVQHYNETLTTHVLGWPAEHLERQAQRFSEEAHVIGSQNSSQISVDLKFARSLVRVSEIQSTLQEQRILFLQQQIHELERLKNESTPNT